MKRFPLVAVVCVWTVLGTTAASAERPESPGRLATWTAPPFWTPAAAAAARGPEGLAPPPLLPTPLPFVALPPCRVVDTRGNGAPLTGGFLPAATERDYAVTGLCGIPPTARAVSFNATVVDPAGPGFLVLFPAGGSVPVVSTLNYVGGDIVANAAVVALGATPSGPSVAVALGVSGGDLLLDVNGYYAPAPNVASLNALTGDVALAAGSNVSLTPAGNTITIAAVLPPGVASLNGLTGGVTLSAGNNITITPSGNTLSIASPMASTVPITSTASIPASSILFVEAFCSTGKVVSGSCGFFTTDAAAADVTVNYSGLDGSNWRCVATNRNTTTARTITYGALCSTALSAAMAPGDASARESIPADAQPRLVVRSVETIPLSGAAPPTASTR